MHGRTIHSCRSPPEHFIYFWDFGVDEVFVPGERLQPQSSPQFYLRSLLERTFSGQKNRSSEEAGTQRRPNLLWWHNRAKLTPLQITGQSRVPVDSLD